MKANHQQKTAWVLVNVGTPEQPFTRAVRKYLREFLDDPRVIDLPFLLRKFLVHAIIVPFRAPRSAKKYRQIWTANGSPLLIHMNHLVEKVQAVAPAGTDVYGLMRYGQPALKDFLQQLPEKQYDEVIVLPLYPQYADSTSGSVEHLVSSFPDKPGGKTSSSSNTGNSNRSSKVSSSQVSKASKVSSSNAGDSDERSATSSSQHSNPGNISVRSITSSTGSSSTRTINQFYDHPGFIASFAERIQAHDLTDFDHILFSYHGLPLRQLQKVHPDQPVADCNCHLSMPPHGHHCYRATCYATTRLLATTAGIAPDRCSSSFQSRLSRNWMTPFTDESLIRLAAEGKKKVLVVPASFVADCLETNLEIGIEYRELFIENGGEELVMAESLNSSDRWVETVKTLMQKPG